VAACGRPCGSASGVGGVARRRVREHVDAGHGEGEGPGLATRAFAAGAWTRAASWERAAGGSRRPAAPSRSGALDGRFGRCRGCGQVHVFCGPCASVGACCRGCAAGRRVESHRRANRVYTRTLKGVAANRERQRRRRGRNALNRRGVTDTISTEDRAAPTPPSPSSSEVEPTRDTEVSSHEASNREESRQPVAGDAVRCARCGRVLSGRVRPSEWIPPRQRGRRRAARQPRARGP
jgi:hypothetical protein